MGARSRSLQAPAPAGAVSSIAWCTKCVRPGAGYLQVGAERTTGGISGALNASASRFFSSRWRKRRSIQTGAEKGNPGDCPRGQRNPVSGRCLLRGGAVGSCARPRGALGASAGPTGRPPAPRDALPSAGCPAARGRDPGPPPRFCPVNRLESAGLCGRGSSCCILTGTGIEY